MESEGATFLPSFFLFTQGGHWPRLALQTLPPSRTLTTVVAGVPVYDCTSRCTRRRLQRGSAAFGREVRFDGHSPVSSVVLNLHDTASDAHRPLAGEDRAITAEAIV